MDFGILLGIVGILLTIFLFFISYEYRKLSYYIRSTVLNMRIFKDKIKKLEVFYEGNLVEKLTISRIILLNKGNKGIDQNDILSDGQVKIKLSYPYEIYNYEILYNENKQKSRFDIDANNITRNILPIKFEYLEPYQGVVIQVLHNGNEKDIKISGNIKEIKDIERINENNRYGLIPFYLFICCSIILYLTNSIYFLLESSDMNKDVNFIIVMIFASISTLVCQFILLKIKEIPFLAPFFPRIIPFRYFRKLNQTWIVK